MESASIPVPTGFVKTNPDVVFAGLFLLAGLCTFLAWAPDTLYILVALHILSAVVWVGGDITLTTLGIVFEQKQDGPTLAALGRLGTWIGTRVYTPALFTTFGFGATVIEKYGYSWTDFWVVFGIVGWSIASIVGVGFVGPELGRIDKAAQEFGPESAEVGRRVKRLFTIFRFDTALLILIVVDMAAKPTF